MLSLAVSCYVVSCAVRLRLSKILYSSEWRSRTLIFRQLTAYDWMLGSIIALHCAQEN